MSDHPELSDTVTLKEPIVVQPFADCSDEITLDAGTPGEVVRCLSHEERLWLILFPPPVLHVAVCAGCLEIVRHE